MGQTPDSSGKLSISEWSVEDRPREKFSAKGASHLSNAELIAILLRTGNNTSSAVELAQQLLHTCDNQLNLLTERSIEQLSEIKGIGPAKAISLMAAFELGKRLRSEKVHQRKHIETPLDVVEIMQDKIAHLRHEEFWCLYLNTANDIISVEQIGKGGISSTTVDIRILIQRALLLGATGILVTHNHPSGALTPSRSDTKLTDAIQKAAALFSINLVDHIILHKDNHFSFQDNGLL